MSTTVKSKEKKEVIKPVKRPRIKQEKETSGDRLFDDAIDLFLATQKK